jgi:hypothetical protein
MGAVLLLVLLCTLISAWPVKAQPVDDDFVMNWGELLGNGSDIEPFIDGFASFPVAYRCPDEPHPGQTCTPGMWYVGSLFGDTPFDNAIEDAAAHRRYKEDWATCEEEKRKIEMGTGIIIDTKTEQLEKAELRAYRAEKAQPILFSVGLGLGVLGSVLVIALIERTVGDDGSTATMEPAFAVRW